MDRLAALEAFVRVAETRSFSEAARRLRSSKSVVSRQAAALEAELGVRLFHRSTRSLTLTEAGQGYVEQVSRRMPRCPGCRPRHAGASGAARR
jgi:DNA-binding transcriptional LysR family regulator